MRAAMPWALVLLSLNASAGELIGKTVPPYPQGLREAGGTCLSDSNDPARVCDYSIGMLAATDDDPDAPAAMRYVVARRMAGRDGKLASWVVTDALPYPEVAHDYQPQTGSCRLDKVDDDRIVAVVRQSQDAEYFSEVAWARRLDLPGGKFVLVDAARVDCVNEGYGEGYADSP